VVPYELGGTVDLRLLPDGVRCKLRIPGHRLNDAAMLEKIKLATAK
jgi:hypothetical protein